MSRSHHSNTLASDITSSYSEHGEEINVDFLTPSERARKKKGEEVSSLVENPATGKEKAIIRLYEQLLQERFRQCLLDKAGRNSLYFFHSVKTSAKFSPFKQKTLRGSVLHILLWGSRPCDHATQMDSYFDWFVLLATMVSCILNALLSDKICERRLHDLDSGSGAVWDGEMGILRTFYPSATCGFEMIRIVFKPLKYFYIFCLRSDQETRSKLKARNAIDAIFTVIISVEMIFKVLAYGLIVNKHSYLRDGWGVFEFVNVVLGWLHFVPGGQSTIYIQLFRIMRPLQGLSRQSTLRFTVDCILHVLRPIASIMLLTFLCMALFAVLGISIFAGTFRGRCLNSTATANRTDFSTFESTSICSFGRGLSSGAVCAAGFVCSPSPQGAPCPGTPLGWGGAEACEFNPNPDRFHFDELGPALISVFRIFVGDKWSESIQNAHAGMGGTAALLYFGPVAAGLHVLASPLLLAACWHQTIKCFRLRESRAQPPPATRLSLREGAVGSVGRLARRALRPVQDAATHAARAICPSWLEARIGDEAARARNLRLMRRWAASVVGHHYFQGAVLWFLAMNTLVLCLPYFSSSEYEDNLCAALAHRIYGGNVSCTGPLSTWDRAPMKSNPGPESTRLVSNRNGFCRLVGSPEVPCFSSLSHQINLDYDLICAEGVCDGMPQSRRRVLEVLNVFFTVIFILEILFKSLAVGVFAFAGSYGNIFDSFVVFANLVEICTSYPRQSGTSALRFFRVLRVSRLLRMLRVWRSVTMAVQKVAPMILSAVVVFMLFVFASAQAGSEILGGKLHALPAATNGKCLSCEAIDGILCNTVACQKSRMLRINFDSYLPSAGGYGGFVSIIAIITRERWSELMKISATAGIGWTADLYLIIVYLLGKLLVLNLILVAFVATYIEFACDPVNFWSSKSDLVSEASKSATKSGHTAVLLMFSFFRFLVGKMSLLLAKFKSYFGSQSILSKVSSKVSVGVKKITSKISLFYYGHKRSNAVHDGEDMTGVMPSEPAQRRGQTLFSPNITILSSISQSVERSLVRLKNVSRFQLFKFDSCRLHYHNLQLYLAAIIRSDVFQKFIFISCILNTIFILAEDPLALRTECCPQGFEVRTNSTFFKGDRFCYRGNQDFLTCSGRGICKNDGTCHCEIYPTHYTGSQCQCRWFSSFLCGRQNVLVSHSNLYLTFRALDYLFVAIMTTEAFLKAFCFGLLIQTNIGRNAKVCAYLQDPLQIWEGFVVILSLCALTWYVPGRESVRTLRLLFTIPPILVMVRPFHHVTQCVHLFYKIAVQWCSSLFVVLAITFLFSIMSLQQFSGHLHDCRSPDQYPSLPISLTGNQNITNVLQCISNSGVWEAPRFNFDSIFDSVLLMLLIATDGWVDVMDSAVDITNVGKSPLPMHSPWTSLYFSFYILVAKGVFLNVFLAIIGHAFEIILPSQSLLARNVQPGGKNEGNLGFEHMGTVVSDNMTRSGETNGPIQSCIPANSASEDTMNPGLRRTFKLVAMEDPKGVRSAAADCPQDSHICCQVKKSSVEQIRDILAPIMLSSHTEFIINSLILSNFIVLALNRFPLSRYATTNMVDVSFSAIYFTEIISKLIIIGPKRLYLSGWNCFDSALTLTIFTVAMIRVSSPGQGVSDGIPELSMLRSVRFFRLCTTEKFPDSVQRAYYSVTHSLPFLSKLLVVALLAWFSFVALGTGAFYNVRWSKTRYAFIDANMNFHNLINAFLVILPISSGDGWIKFMTSTSYDNKDYSCHDDLDLDGQFENESGCGGKVVSVLYFASFYVLNNFIFWNAITATIIFNYSAPLDNELVLREKQRLALYKLVQTYARLDLSQNGFIETRKLRDLVLNFLAIIDKQERKVSVVQAAVHFVRDVLPRIQIKVIFRCDDNAHTSITRYASVASVIYGCMKNAFPLLPLPDPSEVLHEIVSIYQSELSGIPDLLDKEERTQFPELRNDAARVLQFGLTAYLLRLKRIKDIRTQFSTQRTQVNYLGPCWRQCVQLGFGIKTPGFKRSDSDPWGCLRVILVAAKNLRGSNNLRKCDPFATITCCGIAEKSATIVNTNDPIWEQVFTFDCSDKSSTVNIELFDDHKLQPEFLGRILIPISRICLAPGLRLEQWFALSSILSGDLVGEESFVYLEIEIKMYKWILDIQMLGCSKLPEHNLEEKTELNSYVSLIVENQTFYSNPVLGSANPRYPERFRAFISELGEDLQIVVLNNQPLNADGDAFLGQLKINVASIINSESVCSEFFSGKTILGSWESSKWHALQGGDGRSPWAQAAVAIIEARDLPKMDVFGKVDSYCLVRLVEEDGILKRGQRTSIQYSNFHPIWNQEFIYDLVDRNSKILLEVFDHNLDGVNRFIGCAWIDLSNVENQGDALDGWHEIVPVEGRSPPINGSFGSIRVTISIQTTKTDYLGSFGYIGINIRGCLIHEVPLINDFCLECTTRKSIGLVQNEVQRSPFELLDHGLKIAIIEGFIKTKKTEKLDRGMLFSCSVSLPRFNFETKKVPNISAIINPRWCEEFWSDKVESNSTLEFRVFAEPLHFSPEPGSTLDNVYPFDENQVGNQSPQLLGILQIPISNLWTKFNKDKSSCTFQRQDVTGSGNSEKFKWKYDEWFEFDECEHEISLRLIFSFEMLSVWNQHSDIDAVQSRNTIRKILQSKHVKEEKRSQRRKIAASRASHTKLEIFSFARFWAKRFFGPLVRSCLVDNSTFNTRPPGSKDNFYCRPVIALQVAGVAVEKLLAATSLERCPPSQTLDPIRFLEATGRKNGSQADSLQIVFSASQKIDDQELHDRNGTERKTLINSEVGGQTLLPRKEDKLSVRRESELQHNCFENSIDNPDEW